MATYTETAILRVKDQSTPKIKRIDRELQRLLKTADKLNKGFKSTFDVRGLSAARREIERIDRVMRSMRGKTVNVRVNATGLNAARGQINNLAGRNGLNLVLRLNTKLAHQQITSLRNRMAAPITLNVNPNTPPVQKPVNRTPRGNGGVFSNFFAGAKQAGTSWNFGRIAVTGALFTISGHATITAGQLTVKALSSAADSADVDTKQATLKPEAAAIVNDTAKQLATEVRGLSDIEIRDLLSDVALSTDPTKNPEVFAAIAEAVIKGTEKAQAVAPEIADRVGKDLRLLLERSQVSGDPKRAAELVDAWLTYARNAGESYSGSSALSAGVISGLLPFVDGEGLAFLLSNLEDLGRTVGSANNRLTKILAQDIGVSDEQRAKLIGSGFVGADGNVVDSDLFFRNRGAWIDKHVASRFDRDKDGNITAAPDEVLKQLQDMGFVSQELRLLSTHLAGLMERGNFLELMGRVSALDPQDATENNIRAAIDNLAAALADLSAKTIGPLFEDVAPRIHAVADSIEGFALGVNEINPYLKEAATGAAGLATAFAAFKAVKGAKNFLTPLHGSAAALDGSAAALSRAAAALGTVAGVDVTKGGGLVMGPDGEWVDRETGKPPKNKGPRMGFWGTLGVLSGGAALASQFWKVLEEADDLVNDFDGSEGRALGRNIQTMEDRIKNWERVPVLGENVLGPLAEWLHSDAIEEQKEILDALRNPSPSPRPANPSADPIGDHFDRNNATRPDQVPGHLGIGLDDLSFNLQSGGDSVLQGGQLVQQAGATMTAAAGAMQSAAAAMQNIQVTVNQTGGGSGNGDTGSTSVT